MANKSILEQLQSISLSKEEIQAGLQYCNATKEQYYREIDDISNAIKSLEQAKGTTLIFAGTPEEIEANIKKFEEGRDKYIQENSESIEHLESFIQKLTKIEEIL